MFILIRTDLAVEFAAEGCHDGFCITRRNLPYPVTDIRILTDEAEKLVQKPRGRYLTVEELSFFAPPENFSHTARVLAALLRELMPGKFHSALVVGLGNRGITPDALGPQTTERILITRHLQTEIPLFAESCSVSALSPGVLGQTGVETAELVKALCKETKPELVIVIDALAAAEKERLCTSLQFSDTGIVPGSGVRNHRSALTKKELGVPVLAVGVPTVIALEGSPERFVTPREADICIGHAAKLIGQIINLALHPQLSFEELAALTG